jgi:acid stress-induced BolA-like protein IbaG/YrbA
MDLLTKTHKLLRRAFPRPAKIMLEDGDGIIGEIVSARFRGVDFRARQQMLSQAFAEHLNETERKKISIIMTFTPEEQRFRESIGATPNGARKLP